MTTAALPEMTKLPLHRVTGATPKRVLLWWAAAVLAFAVLLLALKLAGVNVLSLTRDLAGRSGAGAEVGILSTAGLVLWGVAGGLCALTAAVTVGPRSRFFAWTAALVILLLVDDAALLHETVLPAAGIPEVAIYITYLGLVLAWAVAFRAQILATEVPLLLLSGAFFGVSVVIDYAHASQTVEDFAKFVGIGTLVLYAFREALRAYRR